MVPARRRDPKQPSEQIIEKGVADAISREREIRKWVIGAVWTAFLFPFIFLCWNLLNFGSWEVGALGWGLTVFLVVLQLGIGIMPYLERRPEMQTTVKLRAWVERVAIFWVISLVLGPFVGWIVTSGIIPITATSWRRLYGLRAFLAAGLPVLLVLPLIGSYIRVKAGRVALPIFLVLTLLAVSSAAEVSLDLWKGPLMRQDENGKPVLYLRYSSVPLDESRP